MVNSGKYDKLCEDIGYQFKDNTLLIQSLTHKSFSHTNNERLEFLGDTILSFVISDILFNLPRKFTEGELTSCRAFLVRGETLMELADRFSLEKYLLLGNSEKNKKNKNRGTIYANAIEAIIAAIYLDSNIASVKEVIESWYRNLIADLTPEKAKDSKTRLQEFSQAEGYILPEYKIVDITGLAHEQTFKVSCTIDGIDITTEGLGTSKRKAEQSAAKQFLQVIDNE